ncbi:MAG: TraR/DksA family transcriptional regulator [Acidobacteria bacterium]|nr:TraR/DksA family transcriptional regulator [Acidobacteriota bacterium]
MAKLVIVHRNGEKNRRAPQRGNQHNASVVNIGHYRAKLLAKEQELLGLLKRNAITGREEADGTLDEADESIFSHHKEITFAHLDRDAKLLEEVRAALQRIDDGTYGQCLADGEPIPEARLNAIPWAAYCVRHQELFENISDGTPIAV